MRAAFIPHTREPAETLGDFHDTCDLTPEDLDRVARDVYDATRLDLGYVLIALAGICGGVSLIWSFMPTGAI